MFKFCMIYSLCAPSISRSTYNLFINTSFLLLTQYCQLIVISCAYIINIDQTFRDF